MSFFILSFLWRKKKTSNFLVFTLVFCEFLNHHKMPTMNIIPEYKTLNFYNIFID